MQQDELTKQWQQALLNIAHSKNTSPVIAGYATRLLSDRKILGGEELVKIFYYAMSAATPPAVAAAWLEGFLKGGGTILLIDINLWNVINNWVNELDIAVFTEILPLLRRTFSNFTNTERRKLGEKVKHGSAARGSTSLVAEEAFDTERAKLGIPIIMQLLGYKNRDHE